jgi:hypothetical protein
MSDHFEMESAISAFRHVPPFVEVRSPVLCKWNDQETKKGGLRAENNIVVAAMCLRAPPLNLARKKETIPLVSFFQCSRVT